MNVKEENQNHTHEPDQLFPGYVNEALCLECKEGCQEDEVLSVISSETGSIQEIPLSSNHVYVKNSSDVHIGDRTYLTIQQNVSSDSEVLHKIIKEVIASSDVRTVLNVETTSEQLESSNGVIVKGLKILEELPDSSFTKSNARAITFKSEATSAENSTSNNSLNVCGRPFKLCAALLVVTALIVIGISYAILHFKGDQHPTSTPTPFSTTSSIVVTINANGSDSYPLPITSDPHPNGWYLVSRSDWGARNPVEAVVLLRHPIKNAIIAHTAGGKCRAEVECSEKMRGIQAHAVGDLGFEDVPYNFLVGSDGNAYEGLGWNVKGSHSNKYNSVSIAIAFIGNYVFDRPTPDQLQAAKNVLAWGVEIGKLAPDYRLIPHNLTHATVSPGRYVYQEIKTWPHFTEERFYLPS